METLNDIVREMRERAVEIRANGLNDEFSANVETLFEMDADRIEAAAKAERIAHEANAKVMGDIVCRLRAALKPVLECEWTEDTPLDASWMAVSEAKRIFNESEVK